MSTYERCPLSINEAAQELLERYTEHADVIEAKVLIDFVFAYGPRNKYDVKTGPALKLHGVPCYGIVRILGTKDRAMGRGDCEILLDGDAWPKMNRERREAVLDHELHHICVKRDKIGCIVTDDLQRPKLKLRCHDHQMGWFAIIAERHGKFSVEQTQAALLMQECRQTYWPTLLL